MQDELVFPEGFDEPNYETIEEKQDIPVS